MINVESVGPQFMKGLFQAAVELFSMWPVWVFMLGIIALRLVPELYEIWRFRKAGMAEIDQMSGLQFEKYLEDLFTRLGYRVERTRYVGDQGGDLILTKGGERILVQAKRYSKRVGNKAVQEAAAARPHYKCTKAMVVANQEFTNQAHDLARSNQVELWGRRKLAETVLSLQAGPAAVTATPIAASRPSSAKQEVAASSQQPASTPIVGARPAQAPTCPKCGKPMVRRQGARGAFWGCSGFPKCRHTMEL